MSTSAAPSPASTARLRRWLPTLRRLAAAAPEPASPRARFVFRRGHRGTRVLGYVRAVVLGSGCDDAEAARRIAGALIAPGALTHESQPPLPLREAVAVLLRAALYWARETRSAAVACAESVCGGLRRAVPAVRPVVARAGAARVTADLDRLAELLVDAYLGGVRV